MDAAALKYSSCAAATSAGITRDTSNRMEVKLVLCLGFKVPLHILPYGLDIHLEVLVVALLLVHYNVFLSGFSPSFHSSEPCLPFSTAFSFSICLFLPLCSPLCDLSCCLNCHYAAVWGLTCTFACCLHLKAILPGQDWAISHVGGCPGNRCF